MSEPYRITKTLDPLLREVFTFTTTTGLTYKARFLEFELPSEHPLAERIYDFSFKPDQDPGPNDPQVQATLLHLMRRFFERFPNQAFYYICDSSDTREYARARLFPRWLREADPVGEYLLQPGSFKDKERGVEELILRVGATLVRSDNPHCDAILSFMKEVAQELSHQKETSALTRRAG